MGQRDCLALLQQNLKQEESMAQKLALFSRELEPHLHPE
jgi:ferritin-like metal-binding protein YciE